jgi:hypothetical protein
MRNARKREPRTWGEKQEQKAKWRKNHPTRKSRKRKQNSGDQIQWQNQKEKSNPDKNPENAELLRWLHSQSKSESVGDHPLANFWTAERRTVSHNEERVMCHQVQGFFLLTSSRGCGENIEHCILIRRSRKMSPGVLRVEEIQILSNSTFQYTPFVSSRCGSRWFHIKNGQCWFLWFQSVRKGGDADRRILKESTFHFHFWLYSVSYKIWIWYFYPDLYPDFRLLKKHSFLAQINTTQRRAISLSIYNLSLKFISYHCLRKPLLFRCNLDSFNPYRPQKKDVSSIRHLQNEFDCLIDNILRNSARSPILGMI